MASLFRTHQFLLLEPPHLLTITKKDWIRVHFCGCYAEILLTNINYTLTLSTSAQYIETETQKKCKQQNGGEFVLICILQTFTAENKYKRITSCHLIKHSMVKNIQKHTTKTTAEEKKFKWIILNYAMLEQHSDQQMFHTVVVKCEL